MKGVVAIILIVVSGGLFYFAINPKYQEIKTQKEEVKSLQDTLAQSQDVLARRSDLADDFKTFKPDDLDALEKLLPDHVDNVQLVLDLNGIASKHGMKLKKIKIDEESNTASKNINPTKKAYGSILVSFQVTSSYGSFVEFLKEAEQSLRIVDVTNLSFKAAQNNSYDFSVTIKTYWLKQ